MPSKIPDSAFVTVGEPIAAMTAVDEGRAPRAEYHVLRRGHFEAVHAMVDEGPPMGAFAAQERFALRAYLATRGLRNVYLGEEFPGIQYLAAHALLRRPKRIAMLIHNVASLRRRLPLATLGLAGLCDHLLCLSARSKAELVAQYGYPASRVTVLGSRVDTEFFSPVPSAAVKTQVCSAGAVNRDYDTLIEAVRPLGVPLKIAADTAWRYSTKQAAVAALPPFVEMRSWGNYVNLRGLYAESAVVVVPLAREILSGVTVALEAMAMGKPVVLTHTPYVEDYLTDGDTGLFVRAGDAEDLRAKIRRLLDHPAEAERMGERARQWVTDRYTVARYVEKILGVWT